MKNKNVIENNAHEFSFFACIILCCIVQGRCHECEPNDCDSMCQIFNEPLEKPKEKNLYFSPDFIRMINQGDCDGQDV
jgi:hypothetical protein